MKIKKVNLNFEYEPFKINLGFKGNYVTGLWEVITYLESENNYGIGLGTQSVLWSDADVFISNSAAGGNALMFSTTQFALNLLEGKNIESPVETIEEIFDDVHEYAKKITGKKNLRKTFTLNSLVTVDNALWSLYAKETGNNDFFNMIPVKYRTTLKYRHEKLACIPLISYSVSIDEVEKMVKEGYFVLKIKIGSDPEGDGDRDKMLKWDMERIKNIHHQLKNYTTPYTQSGKLPYYFDANGRYDTKERLWELINFMDKIGCLSQVIIIEEPFSEDNEVDVSDFPVRIVADESAHTDKEIIKRCQMGYKGVALKPIAKTLSMTLKILNECEKRNMDYFCADITVIPPLIDWNKNLAARIKPLPEMKIQMVEANGFQHYENWEKLLSYHPFYGKKWVDAENGIFVLDNDFYEKSGGIFDCSPHYKKLVIS
ncbi:MAG TPA: L-alanine-DL-glutamate epimerase [Candidatus Ratteibacteria bacterium]|nr:L-alanine-DL-glutamate epimerase [Candidatus Ratteibacteria bacterium]